MSNEQLSTSEMSASPWRQRASQFLAGFIGWPAINILIYALVWMLWLGPLNDGGFGAGVFATLVGIALLGLTTIGVAVYLGATKRFWILGGGVASLVTSIVVIWLIT